MLSLDGFGTCGDEGKADYKVYTKSWNRENFIRVRLTYLSCSSVVNPVVGCHPLGVGVKTQRPWFVSHPHFLLYLNYHYLIRARKFCSYFNYSHSHRVCQFPDCHHQLIHCQTIVICVPAIREKNVK